MAAAELEAAPPPLVSIIDVPGGFVVELPVLANELVSLGAAGAATSMAAS